MSRRVDWRRALGVAALLCVPLVAANCATLGSTRVLMAGSDSWQAAINDRAGSIRSMRDEVAGLQLAGKVTEVEAAEAEMLLGSAGVANQAASTALVNWIMERGVETAIKAEIANVDTFLDRAEALLRVFRGRQ